MTEQSGFFADGVGDIRRYSQAHLAAALMLFARNGVSHVFGNGCQVAVTTPATRAVTVADGCAILQGYYYQNDATITLPIAAADATNPRIDRVVLRLDALGDRAITALVVTGTPAATPAAPSLVRSGGLYDIGLATLLLPANAETVSAVTDTRMTAETCGYIEPWRVSQTSLYPTGPVNMQGQKVINIGAPLAGSDACTFQAAYDLYSDAIQSRNYAGDLQPFAGSVAGLQDLGADHSNPATGKHIYGRVANAGGPIEWLLCNGAEVRKETFGVETRDIGYLDLYARIVDTYGSATGGGLFFRLPNFEGAVMGFYKAGARGYDLIGQRVPGVTAQLVSEGGAEIPAHLTVGGVLVKV